MKSMDETKKWNTLNFILAQVVFFIFFKLIVSHLIPQVMAKAFNFILIFNADFSRVFLSKFFKKFYNCSIVAVTLFCTNLCLFFFSSKVRLVFSSLSLATSSLKRDASAANWAWDLILSLTACSFDYASFLCFLGIESMTFSFIIFIILSFSLFSSSMASAVLVFTKCNPALSCSCETHVFLSHETSNVSMLPEAVALDDSCLAEIFGSALLSPLTVLKLSSCPLLLTKIPFSNNSHMNYPCLRANLTMWSVVFAA